MRTARTKFCSIVKRYWNEFTWNWDVLLSGNPAVDVFNGSKLAAGGELGIGVGEEEWGSGEREVLEDFIGRTEGLVDLIVSRFGDAPLEEQQSKAASTRTGTDNDRETAGWQATGQYPGPADGVIFSGIDAVSRPSVRAVSQWAEILYTRGQDAYGVRVNPTSTSRRKHQRVDPDGNENEPRHPIGSSTNPERSSQHQDPQVAATGKDVDFHVGVPAAIPPSIVGPRKTSPMAVSMEQSSKGTDKSAKMGTSKDNAGDIETGTETMIKYLTLGVYGSKWGIPFNRPSISRQVSESRVEKSRNSGIHMGGSSGAGLGAQQIKSPGHFLIGFQGELEAEVEEEDPGTETGTELEARQEENSQDSRTMVRTLHVDRIKLRTLASSDQSVDDGTAATPQANSRFLHSYV